MKTKQYIYMNQLIKKTLTFFLIQILFCSFLFSQNEWIIDNAEPGKCYYSFEKDSTNQEESDVFYSNTIIEIIDPVFEIEKRKITLEEIEQYRMDDDRIRIQVKPNTTKYVFKRADLRQTTRQREPNGFCICLVEVPAEYRLFAIEELEKDSFEYDYQELKQTSHIKRIIVGTASVELANNQIFTSEGNWSMPKELVVGTRCFVQTVRIIQCRLNDLGYSLEPNNLMDEATKAALIDFQKKNGLPTGQLDFDTLEKLKLVELFYDN